MNRPFENNRGGGEVEMVCLCSKKWLDKVIEVLENLKIVLFFVKHVSFLYLFGYYAQYRANLSRTHKGELE